MAGPGGREATFLRCQEKTRLARGNSTFTRLIWWENQRLRQLKSQELADNMPSLCHKLADELVRSHFSLLP